VVKLEKLFGHVWLLVHEGFSPDQKQTTPWWHRRPAGAKHRLEACATKTDY
jgi:hypothetical protein